MFSFYQNRLLYTLKLILNFGVQEFQTDVPCCSKKFSIFFYVSWPMAISIMDFERCKDVHVITQFFFFFFSKNNTCFLLMPPTSLRYFVINLKLTWSTFNIYIKKWSWWHQEQGWWNMLKFSKNIVSGNGF